MIQTAIAHCQTSFNLLELHNETIDLTNTDRWKREAYHVPLWILLFHLAFWALEVACSVLRCQVQRQMTHGLPMNPIHFIKNTCISDVRK